MLKNPFSVSMVTRVVLFIFMETAKMTRKKMTEYTFQDLATLPKDNQKKLYHINCFDEKTVAKRVYEAARLYLILHVPWEKVALQLYFL